MGKTLLGYTAVVVTMLVVDLLWLGVVAKPLYQQGIGHLMAEQPKLPAAAAFYLLYGVGVMLFAVLPQSQLGSFGPWGQTLLRGALFGFFCYATYDLSNLATLKQWPTSLAVIDIAWGTVLTAVCAAAGKAAVR